MINTKSRWWIRGHFWAIPTYVLCLSFTGLVQAQKAVYLNPNSISQVRFSVMPAVFGPMRFTHVGEPVLTSKPSIGGEISVGYSKQFNHGFGINVGLGYAQIPYNFSFSFAVPPGSPLNSSPVPGRSDVVSSFFDRRVEEVYTIPITVNKLISIHQDGMLLLNLETGIELNSMNSFSASGSYGLTNGNGSFEFLNYETFPNTSFLAFTFKVGLFRFNKRFNSFHLNVVYQFSPTPAIRGEYEFTETGFQSEGTMELQEKYLGLEFAYGITIGKKAR